MGMVNHPHKDNTGRHLVLLASTALLQGLHRDSMEHLQALTVATSKHPQALPRLPVLAMFLDRRQT
jgi:hypothetical protein